MQKESKSFLERLCGNSLKTFVSSLYNGRAITEEDLAELRSFIDDATKEDPKW